MLWQRALICFRQHHTFVKEEKDTAFSAKEGFALEQPVYNDIRQSQRDAVRALKDLLLFSGYKSRGLCHIQASRCLWLFYRTSLTGPADVDSAPVLSGWVILLRHDFDVRLLPPNAFYDEKSVPAL